jgi:VanZ family protein
MRGKASKLAALGWLLLILFSSSSLAAIWSDLGFRWLALRLLGNSLQEGQPFYVALSFAAEKSFHLFVFAVFAMLFWKMIPDVPWKFAWVVAAGSVLGTASELLQSRFPGRDPTLRDILINIAGATAGAAISLTFGKRRLSHPEH